MRERNAYWDNLRFLLICMVVVAHGYVRHMESSSFMMGTFVFINTFHMPLFIFVSGLFHSNKNITKRIVLLLTYALYFKILNLEIGSLLSGGG